MAGFLERQTGLSLRRGKGKIYTDTCGGKVDPCQKEAVQRCGELSITMSSEHHCNRLFSKRSEHQYSTLSIASMWLRSRHHYPVQSEYTECQVSEINSSQVLNYKPRGWPDQTSRHRFYPARVMPQPLVQHIHGLCACCLTLSPLVLLIWPTVLVL